VEITKMQYILIKFLNDNTHGYQEICRGTLVRYTDLDGVTIIPHGSNTVVDSSPVQPSWALEDTPIPVVKPEVPSVVSMRQAQLALFQSGLLSNIQPIIDAMPEPQKTIANIEWNKASEVHRCEGFAINMAGLLGLTDSQLDDLFILAGTL